MGNSHQGGFIIGKIHQLAGRIFAKKLKSYNVDEINPAQGRILFVLWQNDGISIQELAKITSLGKSTLTSMLDRLEASGHLSRIPCKNDRRKTLIHVTQKNNAVREIYNKVVYEMSELFYKGFTGEEIESFEEYLKRVFNNLLEQEGIENNNLENNGVNGYESI